jgi:cell division septation protein DedD
MTHDPGEDGFHEIQLSGKALVFLVMTATVTLVFTFLLGVLVGRQAGEREPLAAFAAGLPPAVETVPASEAVVEPPSPAEVADELSYHRRLQGDTAPAPAPSEPEPPAPRTAEPRTAPPPPAAPPIPADVPTTGRPGTLVVQVFASKDLEPAQSLVRRLAANGHPAFLVAPDTGAALPMYRVQVGRYNDRREAEEVSRRIEKEVQIKPWISSR